VIFTIIAILIFALIYQCPQLKFNNNPAHYGDSLYLSVVTITTLGYGDITPKNGVAKFFTAFESILGLCLFGMLLNLTFHHSVRRAIEKKEKVDLSSSLRSACTHLEFIAKYFLSASGQTQSENDTPDTRFLNIYGILTDNLHRSSDPFFDFNDDNLSNIYYASNFAETDFKIIDGYGDKLEGDSKADVNAIYSALSSLPTFMTFEQFNQQDQVLLQERFRLIFIHASKLYRNQSDTLES
jgi:hypothetical protein